MIHHGVSCLPEPILRKQILNFGFLRIPDDGLRHDKLYWIIHPLPPLCQRLPAGGRHDQAGMVIQAIQCVPNFTGSSPRREQTISRFIITGVYKQAQVGQVAFR
jgi:hypothetical protein